MFEWTRIATSDGQILHMRVLVPSHRRERLHSELDKTRRIYNAMANEWDVFSEFSPAAADAPIKTDYEALFADPGSPDYQMYLDEIVARRRDRPTPNGQQHSPPPVADVPTHDGASSVEPSDAWSNIIPVVPTHADGQQDPPAAADDDGWQP